MNQQTTGREVWEYRRAIGRSLLSKSWLLLNCYADRKSDEFGGHFTDFVR